MRLHHVAYAVANIEAAMRGFRSIGYVPSGPAIQDAARKVRIQFVSSEAGDLVELVEPVGGGSPVDAYLREARAPSVPYHICLEAEEPLEEAVTRLRGDGFLPLGAPSPAPAIGGRRVCFLYGRPIGLVELLEGEGVGG